MKMKEEKKNIELKIASVMTTLSMWGYSEASKKRILKKIRNGESHCFRNGMQLKEM